MSNTLEAEKASRADLELYTAILNTQKTALNDDVDRLRTQLTELRQVCWEIWKVALWNTSSFCLWDFFAPVCVCAWVYVLV